MFVEATDFIRKSDPILGDIIERVGPCTLVPNIDGTHFEAVTRAIVFQQLSGKAASTIYGRFASLFSTGTPTPHELSGIHEAQLRSVGLSRMKATYVKDLAARCLSGKVDIERLHELEDVEITAELTRVKGIGAWTVQMFLIFRLGRPDVLPDLDLGIRKAIQQTYSLDSLPDSATIQSLGKKWKPFCTVAAWYLWRSLEL